MDENFKESELIIYPDDGSVNANELYNQINLKNVKDPIIRLFISSMIRVQFSDRPNIF